MSKRLTLLFVLLIAVFAIGACTSTETTAPEPTQAAAVEPTQAPAPTTAPAEPTTAPAEPTAVPAPTDVPAPVATIKIWADDTRSAILKSLADDFLAQYQVEVIVEEVAGIRDQFLIAAPAGEGPDIIIIPHDQAGTLVANGLLAPIDLGAKAGEFVASAVAAFTYDGVVYGMPYATENLGFFYNKDLVPTPPTTWDEVFEVGRALQEEGKVTFCMSLSGTTYDAYPFQTAYGGYIFGRDAAGNYNENDLGLDSPGMIAAVEKLVTEVQAGCLSDNTDWDTAHTLFETGETPFIMAGPWALDRLRASSVNFGITGFPSNGYPFSGVQGFVINSQSKNVLLAQAFLTEFVATEEAMMLLQTAGNRASAYLPALNKMEDADIMAIGLAGQNAQSMPAIPAMGSVWGGWNDAVVLALQQKQAAADALAEKAATIRALIANPLTGMVNIPGSYQAIAGCPGDWQPECAATKLTQDGEVWKSGPFKLPAGTYEFKVALDGSWTTNFGSDGAQDGPNYSLTLDAEKEVTFTYDPATKLVTWELK